MVKVCDAIMGSGKTQSTITYMNEHPNEKFIYITPYLTEASRIREGCVSINCCEPNTCGDEWNHKKFNHVAMLIKDGANIISTHQMFKKYTSEMLNNIKLHGYTLIIDECIEVLQEARCSKELVNMLADTGYLRRDGCRYTRNGNSKTVHECEELLNLASRQGGVYASDSGDNTSYYWVFPPELITAFKDVIILTYMFKGQGLWGILEHHNIPYRYIGIKKTNEGTGYRFSSDMEHIPEYVSNLKNMIHVIEGKVNEVGKHKTALSMEWFKSKANVEKLKKDLYNVYHNILKVSSKRMRAVFSFVSKGEKFTYITKCGGRQVRYGYLCEAFNLRAKNELSHIHHAAYLSNVFMNVGQKIALKELGIEVDEERYALSTMIQCVWRTAIRNGEEIYLYVPSSRMRTLFTNWLDSLEKQYGEAI